MMELLQECSNRLTNGNTTFNSMFTFEGKHIPSIYEIPKDCKLILLSEKVVETEREDGLEKAFVTGVDPEMQATEPSLKSHYTLE